MEQSYPTQTAAAGPAPVAIVPKAGRPGLGPVEDWLWGLCHEAVAESAGSYVERQLDYAGLLAWLCRAGVLDVIEDEDEWLVVPGPAYADRAKACPGLAGLPGR